MQQGSSDIIMETKLL